MIAMLAASASVSARDLSFSNMQIRVTWAVLRVTATAEASCIVTLEGSLHSRTITKRPGALVGYVIGAALHCPVEVRLSNLPWHVRYNSFFGGLPDITGIGAHIVDFTVLITEPFTECLYASTPASPVVVTYNRNTSTGAITGARLEEAARIPLVMRLNGIVNCQENMRFSGTGSVMLSGRSTAITVTLI
jgi:hypothetical protein